MFDDYTEAHWQEVLYLEDRQVSGIAPAPARAHTRSTLGALDRMVEDGLMIRSPTGEPTFPSIGCEGDCAFERRGAGFTCQALGCGVYLHPGDDHHESMLARDERRADVHLTDLGWSIAGRLRRWSAERKPLAEFVFLDDVVLTRTMYFGCIGRAGHYWYSARLERVRSPKDCPFDDYIDGKLPPADDRSQGADALHHRDGWTAWAMWDYSVDRRGGCNCAFVAPGLWDLAAMKTIARQVFPGITARLEDALVASEDDALGTALLSAPAKGPS